MKTIRLFPLELKRLLQSRLTWLMMALTVLSPVLGLVPGLLPSLRERRSVARNRASLLLSSRFPCLQPEAWSPLRQQEEHPLPTAFAFLQPLFISKAQSWAFLFQ